MTTSSDRSSNPAIAVRLKLPPAARVAFARVAAEQSTVSLVSRAAGPEVEISVAGGAAERRFERALTRVLRDGHHAVPLRPRLPLADILSRVGRSALELDHAGLTLAGDAWRRPFTALRRAFAATAPVIAHPGQPDWLFYAPPASPMFELAMVEGEGREPIVQIDIRTALSLRTLRSLFPRTERCDLPVLSAYAVSLYADVGWRRASLRIDLRARTRPREASFRTWLLRSGRRVSSP